MKKYLNFTFFALILCAIGFGVLKIPGLFGDTAANSEASSTYVVQRRTIEDRVVERGTIESQKTVYGKCEIPGAAKSPSSRPRVRP